MLESLPPKTSIYSKVNLNGADSKLTPPGFVPSKNPKSICIICPYASINIFPLCLSFNKSI